MARRSTRLSSRNSSTPQPIKRVSLSHETSALRAPRTVPSKLSSLHESDEMPGAFPGSASPSEQGTPVPAKRMRRAEPTLETTPKNTTPIRPSNDEMHPKHVHQTTAKPMEEARWLGFSNMAPATEPPKRGEKFAGLHQTPSKSSKQENAFKSPEYQFTFRREQSLELSPEAKKFMAEKRAEAMKIKEQMKSSAEASESAGEALARKIATPKGKKGRFSDLHTAQFQKMDSIAGHASAFRKGPMAQAANSGDAKAAAQTPTKSLKRSPSKAELDTHENTPSKMIPRTEPRPTLAQRAEQHLRAKTVKSNKVVAFEEMFPAKRARHTEFADASATRPTSSSSMDKSLPSTPQQSKSLRMHPSNPHLSHLSTPTQSSLARAASVKSTKTGSMIPGPSLARSPSKPLLVEHDKTSEQEDMPLLARSPTKPGHTATHDETADKPDAPPSRTSPLLSRSPLKAAAPKQSYSKEAGSPSPQKEQREPLLSRSPFKASIAKSAVPEEPNEKRSAIPLLSKSPSKMSLNQNPFDSAPETPAKSTGKGLMGRFNLLRSTPMKSILRSPQRLYSNDPAKVAAGTHMATPPPKEKSTLLPGPQAATAPVRKHVDFSVSTKEREASKSASPAEGPTPPPKDKPSIGSVPASIADYPTLPTIASPFVNPTPERRRQTVAPGDFTFRAGDGIVFGNSPHAPSSSATRPQTIRHVSAEPSLAPPPSAMGSKKRKFDFENKPSAVQRAEDSPTHTQGTKKRKFDFENQAAAHSAEVGGTSDKENGGAEDEPEEGRPMKRVKTMAPGKPATDKPLPPKPASRMPTLGVKPKAGAAGANGGKEKKPSSISRARLNALSQPKRRG